METADTYLTIKAETKGTFRDKASRFIGIATPVSSETDVKKRLDAIRKDYFDANHHCYAYRLGPAGMLYRMNDDGEPSGTAGRPIYGQILSNGLSDLLVTVVRYFGGTKLGVPGLINAYRTAAEEALSAAVPVSKVVTDRIDVTFDYPRMNNVMKIIKDCGATVIRQETDQQCRLSFSIRKSRSGEVRDRLMKLTNICIFDDV